MVEYVLGLYRREAAPPKERLQNGFDRIFKETVMSTLLATAFALFAGLMMTRLFKKMNLKLKLILQKVMKMII